MAVDNPKNGHRTQTVKPANPIPGPHIKVPKVSNIKVKAPMYGSPTGKM